jgi:hypothetical protein
MLASLARPDQKKAGRIVFSSPDYSITFEGFQCPRGEFANFPVLQSQGDHHGSAFEP